MKWVDNGSARAIHETKSEINIDNDLSVSCVVKSLEYIHVCARTHVYADGSYNMKTAILREGSSLPLSIPCQAIGL